MPISVAIQMPGLGSLFIMHWFISTFFFAAAFSLPLPVRSEIWIENCLLIIPIMMWGNEWVVNQRKPCRRRSAVMVADRSDDGIDWRSSQGLWRTFRTGRMHRKIILSDLSRLGLHSRSSLEIPHQIRASSRLSVTDLELKMDTD